MHAGKAAIRRMIILKKLKNILALVLAVALLLTGGMAASAQEEEQSLEDMLKSIVTVDDSDRTIDKAETVYVIAAPDGTADQVIVSEWLKNPENAETISDATQLQDIENTNGYETYAIGDEQLTWAANGGDIHYQGTTDSELPVTVKITYYLDGTETAPENMAGQSGHVTIRFDYTNRTKTAVMINGEQADISVAFLLVSGLTLSNDAFSNVTVSSGTVYNDGSRSIVMGYALPGLAQSLALDESEYTIPDYVEIEADTTDFALSATLTVAINGMLGGLSFDESGFTDWNTELTNFADAASLVTDGTAELSTGAGDLADGLGTISANSAALTDGAQTVFNSLTEAAQEQLNTALTAAGYDITVSLTPDTYSDALAALLDTLQAAALSQANDTAEEQVRAAVTQQVSAQVTQQVTDTVNAQVEQQVTEQVTAALTAKGYTQDQAAAYLQTEDGQALLSSSIEEQTASQTVQQTISTYADQQMASDDVLTTIEAYVARQMETDEVQTQISTAVAQGLAQSESYQSILALEAQLDGFATFYSGLTAYTNGVDSAYAGAQELAAGAQTLADKVQEFYDEGVEKLVEALQIDCGDTLDRLQAIADADQAYQSFGGIAQGSIGSVKFIWRTDGI